MKLADPKKDTIYADLEKFDPQQEPLLREDPSRFVIFPINYQGKSHDTYIMTHYIFFRHLAVLQESCRILLDNRRGRSVT